MQLEPFAYHLAIADALERTEPDLWRWFQREHVGERYLNLTQADLSQRADRIGRDDALGERYALADTAREHLSIDAPVRLFRLREPAVGAQPFLVHLPDEVCIVLLPEDRGRHDSDDEWMAAVGREIARHRLYATRDGRVHVAACLLQWWVRQEGCPTEIAETLRRLKLATEAYCDIGGYIACGTRSAAMRALLRADPSATADDAEVYLSLAERPDATAESTERRTISPDLSARASVLARSTAGGRLRIDIAGLLPPTIELGALDLLDRETVCNLTRKVLARVLAEPATGTLAATAQAREMFPDVPVISDPKPLDSVLPSLSVSVVEYLAFLLLDLATAEGTRLRDAIAVTATAADELGIGPRFREIARQELRGRRGLQAGLSARRAA
jgi:hypothetical protein